MEAIEVASPVLALRVGDVCGGLVQQPRRVRRVVESVARIEAMLAELVCCRILVTSLHPPMDVTDPLGYVIDQLTAIETGAAPLSMLRELRAISGQLSRHDQAPSPGARRAVRASVSRQVSAIICDRPGPSLAVDLRVDCSVVLPHAVAREAGAAASALVRGQAGEHSAELISRLAGELPPP